MRPIAELSKMFGRTLSNNSPHILTAMACTGVVSTAVLAVKATPAAVSKIDAEKSCREQTHDEGAEFYKEPAKELSKVDKVKLTWKGYIPAAAVGLSTMACVIGVNSIHTRRSAALMSVYTITDKAFRDYKSEVIESIGESKERDIRDKVAEKRVNEHPPECASVIVIEGGGDQLFYDSLTDRYFKSDMESVRKAVNDVNQIMINDVYASQNEFYRALGIPSLPHGEELGWTTDSMLEVEYTAVKTPKGTTAMSLDYRTKPIRGYYNLNG